MSKTAVRQLLVSLALVALLFVPLSVSAKFVAAQSPEVRGIAVVQALGNQSDRYVAGKDTAIIVFLSDPVTPSADMQVSITRDGEPVATLAPLPSDETQSFLAFACLKRADCGDWAAGEYTIQADIGGATAQTTAVFQERKPIRILAVPVLANYNGEVRAVNGDYKTMGNFTRDVYPTPADNFDWVLGPELDATAPELDLETEDGRFAVWKMLLDMQPNECLQAVPPANVKCYDQIFGFIKDRPGGTLQGFTYGHHVNIGVESDGDAQATVAHEIGHNYGLGDEYAGGQFNCNVNPPPADYVGADMNNPDVTDYSCKLSPALDPPEGSASLIDAQTDFPYHVGGSGWIQHPLLSFMGSGLDQSEYYWITADAWKQVFDQLDPANVGNADAGSAGSKTSAQPTAAPVTAAESERWVYAAGLVSKNGQVELDPFYSYEDTDIFTPTVGSPYTLRAVDASGKVLATQALEVEFNVIDAAEPLTESYFETVIPFPDTTAAFQVISGTKVLQERKVTAHAPVITVNSPTASAVITGPVTIKWQASDADGDVLHYDVEYSNDGEDWILLAAAITETQWVDDFSDLPGSGDGEAQIIVTATDGVNATEGESALFTLVGQPPEVFIDSPEPNTVYAEGDEIVLEGAGYDAQLDDWILDDNALSWGLDDEGEIGTGSQLYLMDLELGTHVITLTATDSLSQTGVMTATIRVVPPDQVPDPTPLPPMQEETATPAP